MWVCAWGGGWSLTGLFNLIGLWGFEHAPTTSKVRYISRESEKGEGGERQQWEQGERERERGDHASNLHFLERR